MTKHLRGQKPTLRVEKNEPVLFFEHFYEYIASSRVGKNTTSPECLLSNVRHINHHCGVGRDKDVQH